MLAPAHQWLFTPFDAAIGHRRRYSRSTLCGIAPSGLKLVRLRYLDAAGSFASIGNLLVLHQSAPTKAQLRFWDRCLVPISRIIDPFLGYGLGKSIVAIWRKIPAEMIAFLRTAAMTS